MSLENNKQKLVAMMPVRNESQRYLTEVLEHLSLWTDAIVILDDASEDNTYDIAKSFDKTVVHRIEEPLFIFNEPALRKTLWELTVKEKPDWIVAVDADELFEDRIINEIKLLINQNEYHAVAFRIFDFWKSRTHYRVDGGWNPWKKTITLLVRYNPDFGTEWIARNVHCGRFPYQYETLIPYYSDIRVKHYGWANAEDHYKKFLYYSEKDRKNFGKVREFTQSILAPDEKIQTELWKNAKPLYFLNTNSG